MAGIVIVALFAVCFLALLGSLFVAGDYDGDEGDGL